MAIFSSKYPATNFHELNLDWFLAEFQRISNYVENEMEAQIQAYINEHLQDIFMNAVYDSETETLTLSVQVPV